MTQSLPCIGHPCEDWTLSHSSVLAAAARQEEAVRHVHLHGLALPLPLQQIQAGMAEWCAGLTCIVVLRVQRAAGQVGCGGPARQGGMPDQQVPQQPRGCLLRPGLQGAPHSPPQLQAHPSAAGGPTVASQLASTSLSARSRSVKCCVQQAEPHWRYTLRGPCSMSAGCTAPGFKLHHGHQRPCCDHSRHMVCLDMCCSNFMSAAECPVSRGCMVAAVPGRGRQDADDGEHQPGAAESARKPMHAALCCQGERM